jgi:hypothetical protein
MARRSALALTLLVGSLAPQAFGKPPKRDPPLLFGGPIKKVVLKPALDPRLPTGAALSIVRDRPATTAARCSFTRPVCVHATSPGAVSSLVNALAALERAYERGVLALGVPAPLGDADRGGNDSLDLYLSAEPRELTASQEALAPGRMDQSSVFCEGGASGALLEREAALCVGEAVASRLDAGELPEARRAFALELWWLTGEKTSLDVQAVDDAQRHPEHALSDTGNFALFLEMLESSRSAASPGLLSASMLAAAGSRTPPSAAFYDNEPDLFDVLRHSMDEELPRYTDLMVDFALRRALAGDRDDGTRLPTLGFAGAFARPHFDWVIPFSTLPRRVLSGSPIAPSGMQLLWVELDDVLPGASLGFRAEWEAPVAFQWRILLIDREGKDVRRMNVPFQERATSADARVMRLDGAKALLIAGVNVGGVDLTYPFDPDIQPFEPSACTVYLAKM